MTAPAIRGGWLVVPASGRSPAVTMRVVDILCVRRTSDNAIKGPKTIITLRHNPGKDITDALVYTDASFYEAILELLTSGVWADLERAR